MGRSPCERQEAAAALIASRKALTVLEAPIVTNRPSRILHLLQAPYSDARAFISPARDRKSSTLVTLGTRSAADELITEYSAL